VLGASNYTYAEAIWTQQLPDWIGSHARAFQFFGGTSESLEEYEMLKKNLIQTGSTPTDEPDALQRQKCIIDPIVGCGLLDGPTNLFSRIQPNAINSC
jgi:hypothetical protein